MSVTIHNNVVIGPEEQYIPAHLSYGQFMFDQLKNAGDDIALISADTEESMTYKELLQKSINLAAALQKLGLKKDDVVALSSENRFEFMVAVLAVMFNGATLSLLNITYTPGEVSHLLHIVKPRFVFVSPLPAQNIYDACQDAPFVEKIIMFGEYEMVPSLLYDNLIREHVGVDDFNLVDVNGKCDTLAILCSSGTTGLPKGVELTHVNVLTSTFHMRHIFYTSVQKEKNEFKTGLSLIPWFHGYGFVTTLAVLSMGKKLVYLTRFEEKQYLETIQKYKINMTTIVPPIAVFLAKHPMVLQYDLSSLHEVWSGAAPLASDLQKSISQRSGIKYIKNGYGLTEATMACCVDTIGEKVGHVGKPGPGLKLKVVDLETGKKLGPGKEGEVCVKTALLMKGYKGNRAASEEMFDDEGFLHTGDIGYYDEDGFVYIVDRLKELIKYKGFQVAPAELEALLLRHAGVADCGVVGAPDAAAGEVPLAFVVRQPGAALSEDDLVRYIADKVSSAKRLRGGVRFINEIPKNPSGKILRRELKKLLEKPKSKL